MRSLLLPCAMMLAACARGEPPSPSEAPATPSAPPRKAPSIPPSASASPPELTRALAALDNLDGADPRVVAVLTGWNLGSTLPGKGRTVRAQAALSRQLDRDPELETVAFVRLEGEDGPTKRTVLLYVVWIDQGKVSGASRFVLETCTYPGTFELRTQRVHDKAYDDTVIDAEAITACDGHAGTTATTVVTLQRGTPEVILAWKDDFAYTQASGKVLDPKAIVRFDEGGVVVDEEGKGSKELAFDPVAFKYQ